MALGFSFLPKKQKGIVVWGFSFCRQIAISDLSFFVSSNCALTSFVLTFYSCKSCCKWRPQLTFVQILYFALFPSNFVSIVSFFECLYHYEDDELYWLHWWYEGDCDHKAVQSLPVTIALRHRQPNQIWDFEIWAFDISFSRKRWDFEIWAFNISFSR